MSNIDIGDQGSAEAVDVLQTTAITRYLSPTPAIVNALIGPFLSATNPVSLSSSTVGGVILDIYALEVGYASISTGTSIYGTAMTNNAGYAFLSIPPSSSYPVVSLGVLINPVWMIRATYPAGTFNTNDSTSKIITLPLFS